MKASDYKKFRKRHTESNLIALELPSTMVFKVRKPPLQQFIASGQVPASLKGKVLLTAQTSGTNQEAGKELLKRLTPDEILENMAFGCKLIMYACVEPKIVLEPIDDENTLAPEDILPDDWAYLYQWCVSGGHESVTLESFRAKRQ